MGAAPESESVRVVIQSRPLLPFETAHGATHTLSVVATPPNITLHRPLAPDATFVDFDAVYSATTNSRPDALYLQHVEPLVTSLYSGLNATVFAYGQTSAGKSYTMQHITTRAAAAIFSQKQSAQRAGMNVTIRVGFVEIYRERIRDLVDGARAALGTVNVQVRERKRKGQTSVFLDGARERCVDSEDELLTIVREGALVRQTAATGMNASSSRSHSIITITVQQESRDAPDKSCLTAKLHLVDLAGSERAKRTGVVGVRFTEGIEINKGLFALAKVISTLAENAGGKKLHVPYRDSKLTRLLQDSLGGNASTLLVACISPADTSREETLGTLRYAERAKRIRNRPTVNTEMNSVEISDLRAALARARAEICSLAAENERLRGRTPYVTSDISPSSSASPSMVRAAEAQELRDEVEIAGLKYRIAELEGMVQQGNVASEEQMENSFARFPLRRLKKVEVPVLSEAGAEERCVGGMRRHANGPKRRARGVRPNSDRERQREDVNNSGAGNVVRGFRSRSKSNLGLAGRRTREVPESRQMFGGEEDSMNESGIGFIRSTNRFEEMQRTFTSRLKQAEADKNDIDAERVKLLRRMASMQRKHTRELEEAKAGQQSRIAGLRSKVADMKRLEAESTRLGKLKDGSDAARKRMLGVLKTAEKARDDVSIKLAETLTRAETMKRALGRENRELAKSERLLRGEVLRGENVRIKQEAMINRLRHENDSMKNKLRDVGCVQIRATPC